MATNVSTLDTAFRRAILRPVGNKKAKTLATPKEMLRARKRAGLTQIAAAAWCGVDETTVQRWESGQTKKIRRWFLDQLLKHPAKR